MYLLRSLVKNFMLFTTCKSICHMPQKCKCRNKNNAIKKYALLHNLTNKANLKYKVNIRYECVLVGTQR